MANILVTGGLGYIGSHTSVRLLEAGHNIFILDSLKNSSVSVLNNIILIRDSLRNKNKGIIKFFKGDIRNSTCIKEIFSYANHKGFKIDVVFHFAGLKSVRESLYLKDEYWDVNVRGTKVLINSMESHNCRNIVFSSSATVYGNKGIGIIDEDNEINPINNYGLTKANAEALLLDKFKKYKNWKIINLRYFNPIGSHKSYLLGEPFKKDFENLFPILCKVANNELEHLEIFGGDWETRDGTCIRDFIHILDIADGHISALNYIIKNKPHYLNINLGTSKGTTILEFIETFKKATFKKINYVFSKRVEGDVASYVASNKKARQYLNWTPKIPLSEMCLDGWKWYLKNKLNG